MSEPDMDKAYVDHTEKFEGLDHFHPADRKTETFHEPPNYYNRGGYHCFDVMDALGLFTKYYIASAFTYIWRCDFKGDEAEALRDLKKARRYLDWEIKRRETANTRTTHPDPQTAAIQPPKTYCDLLP